MSISPVQTKSRNILLKLFVALVLPLWVAQGCGNRGQARSKQQANLDTHLEHYWDTTKLSTLGAEELEQRLVDYMYLSMNARPDRRRLCWQTIARLFPDEQPNRLVADYLGEPDSPLYAPAMLEEYLEAIAELYEDGSVQRVRIDYLLGQIRKNKVGRQIADLDLVEVTAHRPVTLHSLLAGCDTGSKVLFYDPECEECTALINRLADDPKIGNVVAVSVTGEVKPLPTAWQSCIASDPDQLDECFYLPRLPQLYTVGPDLIILP